MAEKMLIFPVDIELPESRVRAVCDQIDVDMTDGQKIAGIAQDSVQTVCDGGMVLDGNIVDQIRELTGGISNQQELVGYIESGKGMKDGKLNLSWTPDPIYVPALQQAAEMQGVPLEKVGQNTMDYAVAKGWFYDVMPGTVTMFFSRNDYDLLCEMFDKDHLTGTDIASFIRSVHESQPETARGEYEAVQ